MNPYENIANCFAQSYSVSAIQHFDCLINIYNVFSLDSKEILKLFLFRLMFLALLAKISKTEEWHYFIECRLKYRLECRSNSSICKHTHFKLLILFTYISHVSLINQKRLPV